MRRTGNWWDDLGQDIHDMLVWGLVAMALVPILVLAIIALVVFR